MQVKQAASITRIPLVHLVNPQCLHARQMMAWKLCAGLGLGAKEYEGDIRPRRSLDADASTNTTSTMAPMLNEDK